MLLCDASFSFMDSPLPVVSKSGLLRLIHWLNRFVPVVARGIALGLAIVAISTALFEMGEYSGARERYVTAGIYMLLAFISFGISRVIKPVLRWILRRR